MLIWNVFLEGLMGTRSGCIWGWGNSMVGDWLEGQQHICHQIKMYIHKHTKTSQLFSDSLFPGSLCVKKTIYTPHQMDTQNHSKQAPDSTTLYFPRHLPLWKSLVLVFLFSIYQNRHFASELSFAPRCKIADAIFDQLKKKKQNMLCNLLVRVTGNLFFSTSMPDTYINTKIRAQKA